MNAAMHPAMPSFDAEFTSLDDYIRVITARIWEGRQVDTIHRYYGADCAVITPGGTSQGVDAVVRGTLETLHQFPDRRLLCEDIVSAGDMQRGFLSSHRIASTMTHRGDGAFGAATGRPVQVRTVADCVCVGNRIVHEWLVRDQAAIARQIGLHERSLAQSWLDAKGGFFKAAMPAAPAPYHSFVDSQPLAQAYAKGFEKLWSADAHLGIQSTLASTHSPAAITALPGGQAAVGLAQIAQFWAGLCVALQLRSLSIEHLVAQTRPGRATALAMRWRAHTQHTQDGRYGPATGHAVEVLGISHAELVGGLVVREWVLIDDVAVWMQVLANPAGQVPHPAANKAP
jgi:predicted ester cyclase